jgi:hypothetical protein
MEYMLSIVVDESRPAGPRPGEPGFEESMAGWAAYNRMLMSGGHWIAGASLTPSETATTVRLGGDAPRISDGPYAETKEVLGGFYVVAADDLDEALRLAAAIPAPGSVVEVRPIALRPDATGDPAQVATAEVAR